jgi:hypothetical protein
MTARDAIHDAVREALVNDGWTITADPYKIEYEELRLFADIAAERPPAPNRGARKILVEVKSFLGPSLVRDLELALGQHELYRILIELIEPERELYIAVSSDVFADFLASEGVQYVIRESKIGLIIVDVQTQEIDQWTK